MKLLTTKEVERLLGFASGTLAVLRCRRTTTLPYIKMGRSVRYRQDDVEQWLAEQTVRRAM